MAHFIINQDTFFATETNTGLVNEEQLQRLVNVMRERGYNISYNWSEVYESPADCGEEFMVDWKIALAEANKITW